MTSKSKRVIRKIYSLLVGSFDEFPKDKKCEESSPARQKVIFQEIDLPTFQSELKYNDELAYFISKTIHVRFIKLKIYKSARICKFNLYFPPRRISFRQFDYFTPNENLINVPIFTSIV